MLRSLSFFALFSLMTCPAIAAEKPRVIASFSILADITKRIGGDFITVSSLVPADADAHSYEPTPDDIIALSKADMVVMNGLGFENWMGRLIASSDFRGPVVVAAKSVTPITTGQNHEPDPHAWQSVTNVISYVNAISEALSHVDPQHSARFKDNANRYTHQLQDLDEWIKDQIDTVPVQQRTIVSTHDAFQYYARYYEIECIAPSGMSNENMLSAAAIASIINIMRNTQAHTIFLENNSDDKLARQLQHDTGAQIGAPLYADALSPPDGPAPTYVEMMKYNTRLFIAAMTQ